MPTVSVDRAELCKALEKDYSRWFASLETVLTCLATKEFDELCFDFGIELDEDTTEDVEAARKAGRETEPPQFKIDIPANRYDLLCHEGISRSLNIFLGKIKAPTYKVTTPASMLEMTVAKETAEIRPFVVAAVLRNITFTKESYANFIDLQDKLHQNIARKRTLVAIGTHDLKTLKGPFRYEAQDPKDIKFAPLNQMRVMDGNELMKYYEENDRHISRYLHIIRDAPRYPIIYDSTRTVLSLPPIINGDHSKISLDTKDVFIECTGTDRIKTNIVLNMVVAMFSEYCKEKFTVESVQITYPDGSKDVTPHMDPRSTTAEASYINSVMGLSLPHEELCSLLNRMSLDAKAGKGDELLVDIPCTRPDILHQCDIMEDAAIAYGFNNLKKTFPSASTVAAPLAVNHLADKVRREIAMAGWTECLPLILCSTNENFAWLNRKDDGSAVKLGNPKTVEYQVVRTSLLPGLLKTIRENRKHAIPIKVFEVSDVTLQDPKAERKAINERRVCAAYCSRSSGFEFTHGLLDRIMAMLGVPLVTKNDTKPGYYIQHAEDATYFPGRGAHIYLRKGGHITTTADATTHTIPSENKDVIIGTFGIIHPQVLQKFELDLPVSALEFSLERLGLLPPL